MQGGLEERLSRIPSQKNVPGGGIGWAWWQEWGVFVCVCVHVCAWAGQSRSSLLSITGLCSLTPRLLHPPANSLLQSLSVVEAYYGWPSVRKKKKYILVKETINFRLWEHSLPYGRWNRTRTQAIPKEVEREGGGGWSFISSHRIPRVGRDHKDQRVQLLTQLMSYWCSACFLWFIVIILKSHS